MIAEALGIAHEGLKLFNNHAQAPSSNGAVTQQPSVTQQVIVLNESQPVTTPGRVEQYDRACVWVRDHTATVFMTGPSGRYGALECRTPEETLAAAEMLRAASEIQRKGQSAVLTLEGSSQPKVVTAPARRN